MTKENDPTEEPLEDFERLMATLEKDNKSKKLSFRGFATTLSEDELSLDVMHINFGGAMLVEFTKQEDGSYLPTNAMNGWGDNCYDAIKHEKVIIEELKQDDYDATNN